MGPKIAGNNFIFQHNDAPAYTAKIVKTSFANEKIPITDWPVKSSDLNTIENC